MSSEERNGEIWSNRVQKELLALTTDNADLQSTEGRSMIPSFTTVKDHKLDLRSGTCVVLVHITLPTMPTIIVSLDASLRMNSDGSVNTSKTSYPFGPPVARLSEGAQVFPNGSTIKNGDKIGIDLDWTPSLHLTDVILNLGLKIKESIKQNEPFHKTAEDTPKRSFGFGFGKSSFAKAFSSKGESPDASTKAGKGTGKGRPAPPPLRSAGRQRRWAVRADGAGGSDQQRAYRPDGRGSPREAQHSRLSQPCAGGGCRSSGTSPCPA